MIKKINSIKNFQSINQLISFEDSNGIDRSLYLENNDILYLNSNIVLKDQNLLDVKVEETLNIDDYIYVVPSAHKINTLINVEHVLIADRIRNMLGSLYCTNSINLTDLKNYDYVITNEYTKLFAEFGIKQIIVNNDNDFYLKKANEIYVNNLNNLILKEYKKKYEINYRVVEFNDNKLTFKTFSKLFNSEEIEEFYVKEIDINNNEVIYKNIEIYGNHLEIDLYFEKIKEIECIFYKKNSQVIGKIRAAGSERLFQKL